MNVKYFKQKDFKCKCNKCSGLDSVAGKPFVRDPVETPLRRDFYWVEWELIYRLETIRRVINVPLIVTSGFRCAKYNKKVGGSVKSQHLFGNAADILYPEKYPKKKFIEIMDRAFCDGGFGVYKTFVHVDIRDRKARW